MKKAKELNTSQQTRCPKCTGTLVYLRIKNGEFVCRGCGHVWDKEQSKQGD